VKKTKADAAHDSDASTSKEPGVLIVDDDQRTARALAVFLGEAGFRTTVLHTGKDALRHVKSDSVCAAIVDVHLPDLNGLVLSMSLREQLGAMAPIFVVSGDTSMETINSLPHVGATHFFAKPMSPAYLIERLKDCLAKAER
jgi:DNA-binding response OmpR family regulator